MSLDGVMLGTFGLARTLFRIVLHEADSPRGWTTRGARLFAAAGWRQVPAVGENFYFARTHALRRDKSRATLNAGTCPV